MKLVIVESPTKAKTLKKYLGRGFAVEASMGHIRDLPKSKLAVDVENNFEPEYIQVRGKAKIVSKLKKLAEEADTVILAMDPDREGEAIAWHTATLLTSNAKSKDKKSKKKTKEKDPSTVANRTGSRSAQDDKLDSESLSSLSSKRDGSQSKFQRVTFHEITKEAILKAMEQPGEIDMPRVESQQARRVLDRLVGYKLSPLLWKKVRRGLSAGRVQSVALRMIVEREEAIKAYQAKEYWEVSALLSSKLKIQNSKPQSKVQNSFADYVLKEGEFIANLVEVDGKKVEVDDDKDKSKLGKSDPPSPKASEGRQADVKSLRASSSKQDVVYLDSKKIAEPIIVDLQQANYTIASVERKEHKRQAPPPFTTSTLQQAAARMMGWSGKQTMRIAQQLYEAGYITYHRTDSLSVAESAVKQAREYITSTYGKQFIPEKARFFKTKSKGAQEAHEAIRPTQAGRFDLSEVNGGPTAQHEKLYNLIHQRLVASQMVPAVFDRTTISVKAAGKQQYGLRATGSIMKFEGWMVTAQNSKLKTQNSKQMKNLSNQRTGSEQNSELKDQTSNINDVILPEVKEGQAVGFVDLASEQKFTQPPPRFNDASLIKELEARGIGRPSTYASIIGVLVDRGYVERIDKRFEPTLIGNSVMEFLLKHFDQVMDYDFTAGMENDLDRVAEGEKQWRKVLSDFYTPFEKKLGAVSDTVERIELPVELTGEKCPECREGDLVIKLGRFGKFYACTRFPDCKYTKQFLEKLEDFPCPDCGKEVVIKRTRRGRMFYGCSGYPTCTWASWKDPREKKEE